MEGKVSRGLGGTCSLNRGKTDPVGKKREKGEEKERVLERERLHLLSKFPDDRTEGFRWSKRKSSSSRQGLRIETGVGEF